MTGPHRQLKEVVLGRGDYAAGGACTLPFLDQDGARRRRPMVFGEVMADPTDCDPLVASMFSGRASNPSDWAVMWKEIGADGICIRFCDTNPDDAVALVRDISDRTRLPIAVSADGCTLASMAEIDDTVLVLLGSPASAGIHAMATPVSSIEEARDAPERDRRMLLVTGAFPDGEPLNLMRALRTAALEGDERCDSPVIYDATPVWDVCFENARSASMAEGEAALTAMLSGADALIVRGPGAADMARVYGEELADL